MEYEVNYFGKNYKLKTVTIFKGTENEGEVTVGNDSLYNAIKPYIVDPDCDEWFEASSIDDEIDCYVSDNVFNSKNLTEYVEREIFS